MKSARFSRLYHKEGSNTETQTRRTKPQESREPTAEDAYNTATKTRLEHSPNTLSVFNPFSNLKYFFFPFGLIEEICCLENSFL